MEFADRRRLLLFGFLVLLYLAGFNGRWRLEPDSALYLNLGRSLAEGRGYTYHGVPHHLAFPGLPLLFAGVFRLFHTTSLLPDLILMPLIGFMTLGLTYRLFLLHADRPTAVLVTFGLGISRLFYRYCFELLSDMPFLLGVMAFLAGYEAIFPARDDSSARSPRWFDWVFLVGGLLIAVIMRPAMWALLGAIILALTWSALRERRRLPLLLSCLVGVLAVAVLFWKFDLRRTGAHAVGQYEDALFEVKFSHLHFMLRDSLREYAPRLFEASLCQALFGCRLGRGVNTLVGIIVLFIAGSLYRRRALWGLWVTLTVLMLLIAVKPLDRYFLEVLPLLVFGWWRFLRGINRRLPDPWGTWLFAGLFALGGITNLAKCGDLIIEQRWTPFLAHYKFGRFESIDRVADLIRRHTPRDAWIAVPPKTARILTYLSHRRAIEPMVENPGDPAVHPIFVLEPIEPPLQRWLDDQNAHLGPPIGPEFRDRYDPRNPEHPEHPEVWRLRRLLPGRVTPPG